MEREALYGGAVGGGKSSALLMAALQFMHVAGYAALLLRQTFADLEKPDGLIPRSFQWLRNTAAVWQASKRTWQFPSGATLSFGYLEGPNDVYQYQGAAYQFIGWDELTQFAELPYRYMFSRLRKPADMDAPLRMRSGSNPGGVGHGWVKRRFLEEGKAKGRWFIPARLDENPFLDRESYESTLMELDPVTRKQLRAGDWDVQPEGSMFKREWFKVTDAVPHGLRWTRFWDMAATEKSALSDDPDWTVGAKVALKDGIWYVAHVNRFRENPKPTEDRIRQQAAIDGHGVRIRMEQEPGSSGKVAIDHYARNVLVGYDFMGQPSVRDKVSRAGPMSAAAEGGRMILVRGDWINEWLDEIGAFPQGNHDDQVDATSGAMLSIGIPTGAFNSPDDIRVGRPTWIEGDEHFVADRLELIQTRT